MLILGIESSCDETSVALVKDGKQIIEELTISQIDLHRLYGGIIPELAAREHSLHIDSIIFELIEKANISWADIDRIGVVNGPGLISSLLVGVIAAKTLAAFLKKEIVSVNHLKAHICANNLNKEKEQDFPFICLLASGGHTQIYLVNSYSDMIILGKTLDDSAGEAFDKVARMLGLNYPGGPEIEKLAKQSQNNKKDFPFVRPKINEFDFSFSGLKTAVLRFIKSQEYLDPELKADLAKAFQEIVCVELGDKLIKAARKYKCKNIVIAGGVSANTRLREFLQDFSEEFNISAPLLKYCTDNGAMVASAAYFCPENSNSNFTVFSR